MLNETIDGGERQVALSRPQSGESEAASAADQDLQVFEIPGLAMDSARVEAGEADVAESGRAAAGPPSQPPAAAPDRREAAPERAADAGAMAYDVVEEEAVAPSALALEDDADARAALEPAERPRDQVSSRAIVTPAAPPPAAQAPAGAAAGAGADLGSLEAGWRSVTVAEAERLTSGRVVRIGGARIVSSAARGSGAGLEVQTVQLTDRGESIKVVQRRTPLVDARRREALEAQAETPAAPVVTAGLTVRVEDWTVTISGAVAPERLRELAAGLS
jgi:hypothetical protein